MSIWNVSCYIARNYIFNKNFRLKYKNTLITKAFHYFDPNITYDPKSFISEEAFKQSMIFQNRSWNRYSGEDLVKGTYNDIEFFISEILLLANWASITSNLIFFERTKLYLDKFPVLFLGVLFFAPERREPVVGNALFQTPWGTRTWLLFVPSTKKNLLLEIQTIFVLGSMLLNQLLDT